MTIAYEKEKKELEKSIQHKKKENNIPDTYYQRSKHQQNNRISHNTQGTP